MAKPAIRRYHVPNGYRRCHVRTACENPGNTLTLPPSGSKAPFQRRAGAVAATTTSSTPAKSTRLKNGPQRLVKAEVPAADRSGMAPRWDEGGGSPGWRGYPSRRRLRRSRPSPASRQARRRDGIPAFARSSCVRLSPRLHPSLHQTATDCGNVLGPGLEDEATSWTTGR